MTERLKQTGDGGAWGEEYQKDLPPFNPEQEHHEPTPTEVIETLREEYAGQYAQERSNRLNGFPSLSEKDFNDLKLRVNIIGRVLAQKESEKHNDGFSYGSYFDRLRITALNNAWTKEDGAEVHKFDDGTSFVTIPGLSGFYKNQPGGIEEDELYAVIGVDRGEVDSEQLRNICGNLHELGRDADRLGQDLDSSCGYYYEVRPLHETKSMVKNRDEEIYREKAQRRREEYVEKYGPELNLQEIISQDKLDEYKKEKDLYMKQAQIPRLRPNGDYVVYGPDEEKLKEYDGLIETEKKKLGAERKVWKELNFQDGMTHTFDATNELEEYIEALSVEMEDVRSHHGTFDLESAEHDLKEKQKAARRLLNKIQKSVEGNSSKTKK